MRDGNDTGRRGLSGGSSRVGTAVWPPQRSGMLVTIDGQSGAGKTTTAEMLCRRLETCGRRVLLTSTPSPSKIGQLARQDTFEFRGRELTLLVAADRYHHERTVIRPAVVDGAMVVCDRYLASSLVLDPLDGVDRDLIWAVYESLPAADLSIILRGDPALCADRAAARGHYSRFHTSDPAANSRERAAFVNAAAFLREAGYRIIEHDIGTATAEEVTEQLAAAVLTVEGGRK
jgi:dTMP kinase